jgi:D-alanyl-D-alanine carboxypeptidase (penicillin-binding protein 5/6)
MGGTQVFLKEGEVWTLDQLMQAVSVHSANDAAMAVAEGLWGGEDAYKKCMNERATQLGLKDSAFSSVHGLPPAPGQEPDRTTARDMARLGQICVHDPQILKWTSQKEIQFRPGDAVKLNTNKLLFQMEGCDGVKTGYIANAGFCVTATAMRDNIRLISVVMGSDCNRDRFAIAKQILEDAFTKVCRKKIIAKGDPIGNPIRVANCEVAQVSLAAADDLWAIVKVDDVDKIKLTPQEPTKLEAPVKAGRTLGEVVAEINGTKLGSVALLTPVDLQKASWSWKLRRGIRGR